MANRNSVVSCSRHRPHDQPNPLTQGTSVHFLNRFHCSISIGTPGLFAVQPIIIVQHRTWLNRKRYTLPGMFPSIFHTYMCGQCAVTLLTSLAGRISATRKTRPVRNLIFGATTAGVTSSATELESAVKDFFAWRHRATFLATGLLDACLSLGMMMWEWGD